MRRHPITRKEQAKQTREKIFQSVLELIKKDSWNELQINNICKHCGVSVGTFYHYFPSKQSLIISLINDVQDDFLQRIEAIPHNQGPMQRILDTAWEVNTMIEDLGKEIISGLFVYDLALTDETVFTQLIPIINTITVDINALLAELDATSDAETVIDFLAMLHRGILYDWCSNPNSPRLREHIQLHFKSYLEMLVDKYRNKKTPTS
ncbi:MAG: TetR/AcrR family transcriptional regulator [Brevinema sp.]